ncbi:VAN3-binding protein-like [Phragmites australis]|uniref:VAN3-binding protein-like n=1 Tax=Phragmites australis TaxID=29695 RepID=UPI002D78CA97|nr:VAN3-binding protein-like [Phragmites australis]
MEPDRGLIAYEEPPLEPMDLLSSAWCSSAIQVLQKGPKNCSMALVEHPVMALDNDRKDQLQKSDRSLVVDNSGFSTTQWKYDDLKSWIWLQKAIHPELDYDLCLKKKWLPRKMAPWSGISLKKWVKERKQKRKEEARLNRAEVHAAVSVAGVAAALAAIAAENAAPPGSAAMRETAVASAAALVAEQCAKVAEAAGATRDQIAATVAAAVASTDAGNVITLTAAAATSLRGAATLRGRRSGGGSGGNGQNERAGHAGSALSQDDLDFDFNHARSRAALAKGDEMFVAMPDRKWKLHTVSAASNKRGEIVLRIKKTNLVMAFSHAKECVVHDVRPCAPEKPSHDEGATYPVEVSTSKGKVELRADDYAVYKRWVAALSHMLVMSTAVSTRHEPPRRD